MISVVLWKEYREHRIVWVTLALVAAAALLFPPLAGPPDGMRMLAVALAWTYGLICGAMLLAGEREVGTLSFLNALPGLRWRLWLAKCLAGILLVFAQIVWLMILAAIAHLFVDRTQAARTLQGMCWGGFFGFAWGMLFSSYGRSVVNMILLALGAQVAALTVTSLLVGLLAFVTGWLPPGGITQVWETVAAVALLTIPPALAGSAFLFTRLDRGRLQPLRIVVQSTKQGVSGWRTWLQSVGFALGVTTFALVAGLLIPVLGPMVWPTATLVVGILCGATAFNDEQKGLVGDLGNRRLSLFRFWIVKVGVRLVIALTAAAIMAVPSLTLALSHWYGFSAEFLGLAMAAGQVLFLTMGLVYGFCLGVFCGLLFRGLLASAGAALLMSLLLAAIWTPSVLASGLHPWQPLGPPILLLAATPLLLRPWAADRIASQATGKRLAPFMVLIGVWILAGLWYRVYEIPNVPDKVDLAAYRATLPADEDNKAGVLVRSACADFSHLYSKITGQYLPIREPSEKMLDHGWSGETRLAAWLDKMCAGSWLGMLKEASELPPGVVEDMPNLTYANYQQIPQTSREITLVLAAHGLQYQAAGDDEAFVDNLRIGLSLSRAMRQRAPLFDVQCGRENEVTLLKALDRWLERLQGRPDLLRKALDVLSHYADATANVETDQDLMEDLMIVNAMDAPVPSLQAEIGRNPYAPVQNFDVRLEAQWIAAAWRTPWEHQRQQRVLRVLFWGDDAQRMALALNRVGPSWLFAYYRGKANPLSNVTKERAGLLKLALRLYQADNGKPAENLEELVPKYLPSIPLDPYDGKPFRYRLSHGEEIDWPPEPTAAWAETPALPPPMVGLQPPEPAPHTRKIPPGQGVLWSVGTDGIDDGGHRPTSSSKGETGPGEDIIFLVPLPPKAK